MQTKAKTRQALTMLAFGAVVAGACHRENVSPMDPAIDASLGRDGLHECIAPPARGYSRMVYDARSDQVYLFGGFSTLGFEMDILDVWAFDLHRKRWRLLGGLDPRDYDALALDTQSRKVIVFQPFVPDDELIFRVETWAYDIDHHMWENMRPASEQPASRWGSRMAYDAESDRVVLFGGSDIFTSEVLGDTWAYDYESNTWTNLHPEQSAPPHHFHDMVYHEAADRIVLFGGFEFVAGHYLPLGDTWTFDVNANTWTELHPAAAPPARAYAMLAYEGTTRKIVMFGGVLEEVNWPNEPTVDETWTFDLEQVSWTQGFPRRSASSRAWHQMVGIGDEVLLFGGGPSRFEYTNETYTYRTKSDPWNLVKPCRDNDHDNI